MVEFGNGSRDWVGMQIPRRRFVSQANDVPILEELEGSVRVIGRFVPSWENGPVVILVLVMVTGDLLLQRPNGECLHVRVKQTTSPSHVLEGEL